MSQPVEFASWGRGDHDLPSSGSLRAARMGVRRSARSFHPTDHPPSPSSSRERSNSESSRSGHKRRRRSKAPRVAANAQTNVTLDSSLVAVSFEQNGLDTGVTGTPSLTSSNNFINFCETVPTTPISDGTGILGGSCNPTPMGQIPPIANMPLVHILQPANGATLAANVPISLSFVVSNLHAGVSVNTATNYMSAPQQLDPTGDILGNLHVVIEELDALNSTVPMDNQQYVFFRVVEDAPEQGIIQSSVPDGIPEGFYRVTVMTRAANHQPVIVPISEHGSLNDVAYITVTADGAAGSTPSVRRRAPIPQMDSRTTPSDLPRHVVHRDTDPQSSLTLETAVIAGGFSQDGQNPPVDGQSASLTSTNNYINFCAMTTQPLINATGQLTTGFCNPAPMGLLPASTHMPSSKFTYPRNGDILAPNSPMIVGLAVTNFATGFFANMATSLLSAPQQLDSTGHIQGHPLIVFEQLTTNPNELDLTVPDAFFLPITTLADTTGVVTVPFAGLPVGFYRVSSILVATNGQPVLLPVMSHGAVDDSIYITVADGGSLPTNLTALPPLSGSASGPVNTTDTSSIISPSSPSSSATSASTGGPATDHVAGFKNTHVGAAVGGAVAGTAVVVLLFALWFFLRRRNKARAPILESYPVTPSSYFSRDMAMILEAHPGPSSNSESGRGSPMMELIATPAALYAQKGVRSLPSVPPRRYSATSLAPSYHSQA